jgi:hypothetical protein
MSYWERRVAGLQATIRAAPMDTLEASAGAVGVEGAKDLHITAKVGAAGSNSLVFLIHVPFNGKLHGARMCFCILSF